MLKRLTDSELEQINAWRRVVVRLWLVTMGVSVLVWAAAAAFVLPHAVQIVLGVVLVALVVGSILMMRRGRCPRCGQKIRFAPRIELPLACGHCGVPFHSIESRGQ